MTECAANENHRSTQERGIDCAVDILHVWKETIK